MMKVQLLARLAQIKLQWAELRDQLDAASARGNWLEFGRLADGACLLASEAVLANIQTGLADEEVTRPGPTGEYPQGKLLPDDAGELQLIVGCYRGNVVMHFGKPIPWFACPPSQGRELAAMFIAAAEQIEGRTAASEAIVALPADIGPADVGRVQDLMRQLSVAPEGAAPPPDWQERVWSEVDAEGEPALQDPTSAACPECARVGGVTRALVDQELLYGDAREPEKQVALSVRVPQYTCLPCGFVWTDDEAENLREAAVRRHLSELGAS